jgi:glutamate synthase domain-containing protein 3
VVVLGKTGRNFAAGMTGGLAYVLDETGEFVRVRCNRASVDLAPVINSQDIDLIQNLIARHAELTESPRAKWILDNWETMLPKFIKVFPHEYKRVLGIPRSPAALASGSRNPESAIRNPESGIRNPESPSPTPPPREVLRG